MTKTAMEIASIWERVRRLCALHFVFHWSKLCHVHIDHLPSTTMVHERGGELALVTASMSLWNWCSTASQPALLPFKPSAIKNIFVVSFVLSFGGPMVIVKRVMELRFRFVLAALKPSWKVVVQQINVTSLLALLMALAVESPIFDWERW